MCDLKHDTILEAVDTRLLGYFIQILNSADCNDEKTLWTLLALERCCLKKVVSCELKAEIKPILDRLSNYYQKYACHFGAANIRQVEYQVGFCAQWLLENLFADEACQLSELVPIKLLNDRLNVRVDNNDADGGTFETVRSAHDVSSDVYYYEVAILNSTAKVRVGWSTAESRLDTSVGIGGDKYSIAFDPVDCSVWHNNQIVSENVPIRLMNMIPKKLKSYSVNVIGCFIDTKAGEFAFYLNGMPILHPTKHDLVFFSAQPYFAAVSLAAGQQCHFNFGQGRSDQLKHFPTGSFWFKIFHSNLDSSVQQNLLNSCKFLKNCYLREEPSGSQYQWFKREVVDDRVQLFFQDSIQVQFDELIRNLQREDTFVELEFDAKINFDRNYKYHRIIQSVIEVFNTESLDALNRLSIQAEKLIKKVENWEFKEKYFELLYPYFQLNGTGDQNSLKHRNICIILSFMIKCCTNLSCQLDEPFQAEVYAYLVKVSHEVEHKQAKFYSFTCLADLPMTLEQERNIRHDDKMFKLFEKEKLLFQKNVYTNIYTKKWSTVDYQLYFVKEYLFKKVFDEDSTTLEPVTLNRNDRTQHLKLSTDLLCARSDASKQSVRSVLSVKSTHLHHDLVYYEVVLLSAGPMRIGWSTVDSKLNEAAVGGDEHSIGYDGFHRCVWHDNKRIAVLNQECRWKIGDVVGCLIDVKLGKFSFYLNQALIECDKQNYYCKKKFAYHASVTLAFQQQCYFNFGQDNFVGQPKAECYINFHHIHATLESNKSASVENAKENYIVNAVSSLVVIKSQTRTGNVDTKSGDGTSCFTICGKENTPTATTVNSAQRSFCPTNDLNCKLCERELTAPRLRFVCCEKPTFCKMCIDTILGCVKCSIKKM